MIAKLPALLCLALFVPSMVSQSNFDDVACPLCGKMPDPDDPNNDSAYVECEPNTYPAVITGHFACPFEGTFDAELCDCFIVCPDPGCPFIEYDSPDCNDFVYCEGQDLLTCLNEDWCWDQEQCTCVKPVTCPDCGALPVNGTFHEYDRCSYDGVIIHPPIRESCGLNFFIPESCTCLECDGCADDPNSSHCGDFYTCFNDELAHFDCGDIECYEQHTCSCRSVCTQCSGVPLEGNSSCFLSCDNLNAPPVCCAAGTYYNTFYCGCHD